MDKLKGVIQQIQTVYQVYNACPIFGVDFEFEDLVSKGGGGGGGGGVVVILQMLPW